MRECENTSVDIGLREQEGRTDVILKACVLRKNIKIVIRKESCMMIQSESFYGVEVSHNEID